LNYTGNDFLRDLTLLSPDDWIVIGKYKFGQVASVKNGVSSCDFIIQFEDSEKKINIKFFDFNSLMNYLEKECEDIRICNECGYPMQEGWVYENSYEHYCSKECYTADANRTWGKGNWRITGRENEEGGFLEFLDENDGQWEPLKFYWTYWY